MRPFARQHGLFPVVMVLTVAMTFMPRTWLGWVDDLSAIVRVPITPLGELGNVVAALLRPPPESGPRHSADEIMFLEQQIEELRTLLEAERLRSSELASQLEQLQRVAADVGQQPVRPLLARITGRDNTDAVGPVELNRGERSGVTPGTVAVYRGVHLIGRVSTVSSFRSTLTAITDADSGYLTAAILPHDRPEVTIDTAPLVQLEPKDDGTLVGDVDRMHVVGPGDVVRLIDSTWPNTAQAMIIGVVDRVEPKSTEPLRNVVTVRPRYQVFNVYEVTLKIEEDDLTAAAGAGGSP